MNICSNTCTSRAIITFSDDMGFLKFCTKIDISTVTTLGRYS